jgi:hypothetical protein
VVIDDISGNGKPEVALLTTVPDDDDNVRVQVKDSVTGATVNNVYYGNVYSALDMTVLPDTDGNGADELLVLGINSIGEGRAQARDALTKAVTSTLYNGSDLQAKTVLTIPDLSTNGEPEVLVRGPVSSTGQELAQLKDSSSREFLRNIYFGTKFKPVELAVVEDISGDGVADLAQLAVNAVGEMRVQVWQTDTGAVISTAFIGATDRPIAIVGIGNAGGSSAPDTATLLRRPDTNNDAKIIVRDGSTGAFLTNIFYYAVFNPTAATLIADLDMSGDPELVVLGDNGSGVTRVQIRDSISGANINTINFY